VLPPELDSVSGELHTTASDENNQTVRVPWEETLGLLWSNLDKDRGADVRCCTVQEAVHDAVANQLTHVLCAGSLYLVGEILLVLRPSEIL